ncbi:hypothetical protein OAG82_01240 [Rubripirellula sp.]|nr:FliG C-terminal domain-containing protein [Rubripirellula sp.]MDB4621457.1 hypothetical protein [Rubripirellula sp.]
MGNGWDSGLEREAMLRRVAIVLSSLPAPVAANLLGEIDADTKVAVRRTMMSLTDVDPLEQKRALHAFKVSVQKPEASLDQFQVSSGRKPVSPSADQTQSRGESGSRISRSNSETSGEKFEVDTSVNSKADEHPLAFLEQVDEQVLVHLLKKERPQIIATVLASIRPEHAARVLARHGSGLEDMLGRIGKIEAIPPASLAELADHFRLSLDKQFAGASDTLGRRALDAILAAMPGGQEQRLEDVGRTAPRPQTQAADRSYSSTDETAAAYTRQQAGFPSAVTAAENLTSRLRIAEETLPTYSGHASYGHDGGTRNEAAASLVSRHAAPDTAVSESLEMTTPVENPAPFSSTDSIHQHLLQLSPQHLCETLGKVQARVAMLALCGLPNQITSAVLALLPKAESRKVREAMNSLGALQLREIDEAKEAIANASIEVVDEPIPNAA